MGPEGDAPSPSAAVGGPALSLPATFSTAGHTDTSVAANAAAAAGMTKAVMRAHNHLDVHRSAHNKLATRLNDHRSAHNKLTVAFNELQTRFYVSLSVLNDQHAMIEALTRRIDRLEGLRLERLQRADSPEAP